ncbi:MAG: CDP-alcohol phosphatidyltransferase family protein [Alkalispirochaeta sp.]
MTFDRAYHWWNLIHAAVLTVATVAVVAVHQIGEEGMLAGAWSVPLQAIAVWSGMALLGLYWASRRLDSPRRGYWIPDVLTSVRGVAAVVLFWVLPGAERWPAMTIWIVGAVLALVEVTDFFDGRLARRFGASSFGAVWDMENDALFTLSLSLLVYLRYGVAPFLILLGLMRYLYVLVWRFDRDPVTVSPAYKRFAKIAAAAIVATLIAAVAPIVPPAVRSTALMLVLGMQLVSFGWDLVLQYRALRLSGQRI